MSLDHEIVDGTVADEHHDVEAPAAPSSLPARRERRSEVIRPLGAEALVQSFSEYQALLPKLLSPEDWQDAGRGERFVKKSGWRKIATAFDLDVMIVSSKVDRGPYGVPLRAEVIARAVAPSGRSMDGDGYCSVEEPRFEKPKARQKLENDLRATAATRAKNRAISDLVGMGAVSAEEVSAGPAAVQLPAWAERATPEVQQAAHEAYAALTRALDASPEDSSAAWQRIGQAFGGTMPAGFAAALVAVAGLAQVAA